jgi:hypothetical protein
MRTYYSRSSPAPRIVAVVCALFYLWALSRLYRRFILDDASGRIWSLADDIYISASFGRTFVSGHGLVWYPGAPRVEGISNPFWSALIGFLHVLPGFTEDRLGLFVVAVNGLLLVLFSALFCALAFGVSRIVQARISPAWSIFLVPISLFNISLIYWSAEGFEVALIAVLAFAMWGLSLKETDRVTDVAIALVFVAGLVTRMDFILLSLPSWLILFARARLSRRWVRIAMVIGLSSLCAAVLFIARWAYYGDWLPNTYYLKVTGWPWKHRLATGLFQNQSLIPTTFIVWLPLLIRSVRRRLRGNATVIVAVWLAFVATVIYSTYVGGDTWRLFAGYDRYTSVGAAFLTWGLAVFVFSLNVSLRGRLIACVWALMLAAWPIAAVPNAQEQLTDGLVAHRYRLREYERRWILYGKAFEEISLPGSTIAICPAGAIVYFSHRGGVDLLGKVEPTVAHLQASLTEPEDAKCWRDIPGHLKEDTERVFELRTPVFSRSSPPLKFRDQYVRTIYKGYTYFVRRGTPLAKWNLLNISRQREINHETSLRGL